MSNGDNNLLILTLYIIGVTYTFNQMVESIDDQVQLEFKKANVEEWLKERNLQDKIGINFSLKATYPIDEPKELSMSIENKSQDIAIYVDWDRSAFEEFDGASRRVIRKTPDMTRDLAVPQIPSLIVPGKTLRESVTSESVLQRDQVTGTYTPKNPLANIVKLKTSAAKAQKATFNKFLNRQHNFEFSLDLVLKLERNTDTPTNNQLSSLCVVKCPFVVRKLPWTYALPWNKKR